MQIDFSNNLPNLPDQDSNLDKQNQNLLCYRYTIGQVKVGGSVAQGFLQSQALSESQATSNGPEVFGTSTVPYCAS